MLTPELQTLPGVRERQEKSESRRAPEGGLTRENGPRHRANMLVLLFFDSMGGPDPRRSWTRSYTICLFFDPALGVTCQFGRGNLCDWGSFAVLREKKRIPSRRVQGRVPQPLCPFGLACMSAVLTSGWRTCAPGDEIGFQHDMNSQGSGRLIGGLRPDTNTAFHGRTLIFLPCRTDRAVGEGEGEGGGAESLDSLPAPCEKAKSAGVWLGVVLS